MRMLLFGLLLATALALAGCTGGDDSDESTTTGPDGSSISGETTAVDEGSGNETNETNSTNETTST